MFYSPGENSDSPPSHTKFSGGKSEFQIVFGEIDSFLHNYSPGGNFDSPPAHTIFPRQLCENPEALTTTTTRSVSMSSTDYCDALMTVTMMSFEWRMHA